jgi:predicted glycogen debranching enzyme
MTRSSFGREICGDLPSAERREWLCTNGIGGFASGTVAGILSRRYHGLLVAALKPPLGRTLLVAGVDETVIYDGLERRLGASRWADGTIDPRGYLDIEHFALDGTTPVWTYAISDALVEKRIWMEQGANTTYVRYRVVRARTTIAIEIKALVDHRDYHGSTRGDGWRMDVTPVARGLRSRAPAPSGC